MGTPTYIPMANITLGSSAASVTFSSISQAYRDLVLVANYNAGSPQTPAIRVNSDTASNYSNIYMRGTGSAAESSAFSGSYFYIASGSIGGFSEKSHTITQFMDYSTTDKHKSVLTRTGNTEFGYVDAWANRWASTSAITTIQVFMFGTTFTAGSTFALYGVAA